MNARRFARFVLPSLLLSPLALGCASRTGPSPDLRLRRVVLYQNGIGYFERSGVLEGGHLQMKFREREVDDVLKSIVVIEDGLDVSREKPSTVNLRLQDAATKRSPDEISTLDLILSREASRRVSIAYATPTAAWKATYRVILPTKGASEKRALLQAWALIDNVSDEDWTGVKLSLATGAPLSFASDLRTPRFIERPDATPAYGGPAVNGAVVSERAQRGQAGDSDGDGILDTLDKCPDSPEAYNGMDDEDGCPDKGRVIVEGNNIQILQHVRFPAGWDQVLSESAPIVDAIAATLKAHPELRRVTLEGHASHDEKDAWVLGARRAGAVRAQLVARGVTTQLDVQAFGDTRPLGGAPAADRRVEFRIVPDEGKPDAAGVVQQAAAKRAPASASLPREVAGAMRYDISDAVSIPNHASSLVTIVNEYLPGEEVLLFRPDPSVPESASRPFRAARLESPGALGLQPGSVAIFSGGSFVGEGLLARLNPGETVLIPYALDGGTEVRTHAEESDHPLRIVSVARGQLTVEDIATRTTRYEIAAGKQTPARLVVRHDRLPGTKAEALPPGTESTPETYLIPIPLTPERPSVLTVDEKRTHTRTIAVVDIAGATLGLYLRGSQLPPELEKRVREIATLRADMETLDGEMSALRTRLGDAAARAGELRENLRAVEKSPRAAGLQKQLVDRLTAATKEMDQLAAELAEKGLTQATAKSKLAELVRGIP